MRNRLLQLIGIIVVLVITAACTAYSDSGYEVVYSLESQHRQDAIDLKGELHEERPTIAMVAKSASPYFSYAEEGAREAARQAGIEVTFESPRMPGAEQQIEVVEQLIRKDVDVIAISAIDPEKLIPMLVKARNQGIRVITWDSDTMLKGREFFVNQVETEVLGRHLMDNMAQAMGEKGKFVVLGESRTDAYASELLKWIQTQCDENYPHMMLDEHAGDIKGLLGNRADIGGILELHSIDHATAAEAVKEAGQSGKVKVTGLYAPSMIRNYLHDGLVQKATLWSPKKLGYVTVMLANDLLSGRYPTDGQDVPGAGSIRMLGNTVIMDEPIDFTRENVDQYDF
ncbi:autoinducer 2 ABC transporter substrate-binding protein [Paenibacillus harenae]|uniref:autoinducer 2 ABC transporter substrate-binding protein n=1 Tax=Paenibacillus harenae TaxID=306543 RepID=UPI002794FE28|nr:autoinducer 2 ABC transporter substrate-binding protein [Paenibacillus harenae]MDQ0060314.1 rhamnose transport system substrate-binding protein [Paenibacillus harenae]